MSSSSVGEDVTVFDFIELLQASDWVSSPVYAGWLQKKSKGWLVSQLFTQLAWQPKWVSLHGLELVYMDEEPTNENIASIRIRRITIGSTTKIMPFDEEDRNDPLCFSIQPDCTKPRVWQFRAESDEEKTNWLIKISQVHAIAAWLDSYTKEKVLGVGAQGTVYEIVHKSTGERHAMKEVSIENDKQMQMAITEAKLLMDVTRNVSHPCIMQIEKVFQVVNKFYLVFPLCTGGELYDAVVRRGHFTERKAARIIRDIVSALHALHEHNILHLDIKPENILFESNEPNARVKITDFGLSKIFNDLPLTHRPTMPTREELQARTESFINCGNFNADHVRGTFGYMSPELILSGYTSTASDVFAAGVILYILLCGYPPFNSKSVRQLFVRTVKGAYKLSGPEWDSISPEAKDLVRKMLDISPNTRISTKEILAHPWIQKANEFDSVGPGVPSSLTAELGLGVSVTEGESGTPNAELFAGLHGKSSVVHGHLLKGSFVDTDVTAAPTEPTTPASSAQSSQHSGGGPSPSARAMASRHSDVSLTRALDHLAGHIKELKTEKLAKQVTRLMLAKANSGGSKLAALFLHRVTPAGALHSAVSGTGVSLTQGGSGVSSLGSSLSSTPRTPRTPCTPFSTRSLAGALAMTPIQEEDESILRQGSVDPDDGFSDNGAVTFSDAEVADLGLDIEEPRDSFNPTNGSVKTTVSAASGGSMHSKFDELQQMVNSAAKEAVTAAVFAYFGADAQSRLTIPQFILLLKRFGMLGADTTIPSTAQGTGLQLRDPSGPTTTTNGVLHVTADSTISPYGRGSSDRLPPTGVTPLALSSVANHPNAATAAAQFCSALGPVGLFGLLLAKFVDREDKGFITPEDFFTAQVLILQNNELYLRALFCQYQHSAWYPGRSENFKAAQTALAPAGSSLHPGIAAEPSSRGSRGSIPSTPTAAEAAQAATAITANVTPYLAPRNISAKHTGQVFERYGYDPRSGHKVFNLLCDVLAKVKSERRHSSYNSINSPIELRPDSSDDDAAPVKLTDQVTTAAKGIIGQRVRTMSENDALQINTNPSSGANSSANSPSTGNRQMDVEEFIHIAKFDEVLVDVFSKDAHQRLFSLFQRAEGAYLNRKEVLDRNKKAAAETPNSSSSAASSIQSIFGFMVGGGKPQSPPLPSPEGGEDLFSPRTPRDVARDELLMDAVTAEVRRILDDPLF